MDCQGTIKNKCGTKVFATCTVFEGTPSNGSTLTDDCITVEDAIQDLYDMHDEQETALDLTDVLSDCITFTAPKTLASVLNQILVKVCEIEQTTVTQAELITTMQAQIVALQEGTCP